MTEYAKIEMQQGIEFVPFQPYGENREILLETLKAINGCLAAGNMHSSLLTNLTDVLVKINHPAFLAKEVVKG